MSDTHPLRSFRERNVRIFFAGLAVSNMGRWIHTTAAILLVQELGGGGLELGIVTAAQFLPVLLFGLYAGAYADRSDRYRLVIAVQVLMGLIALGLGVVDFADGESIVIVYIFTAALGFVATFDNPARRTLATELVPPDQLANIVALSTSVMVGSRIAGPALAVLIVTQLGTAWAFTINGISFLGVIVAMFLLDKSRFHPIEPAPRSATPIRDGLREVWSQPGLPFMVIGFALVSTFTYNYLVGFPLLIDQRLGAEPEMFGWMLALMSAGNVVGSLTAARLTEATRGFIFRAATWLGVSLTIVALSTSLPLTFAFAAVMGMGSTAFVNGMTIHVQQRTDPQARGRVLALTTVIFQGSTPIGAPITGVIGDSIGAVAANLYGAVAALLFVAAGLIDRQRRRGVQPAV